ncbi:MAG: carboxyl-terminal protease [Mongoliibacter sp.]|uniref:S41 family peptidase n=1 Tax=Mongoliibacter sp. TaxID=2022438 RepID=UPI0012F232EB|nr:S41 family peptidase [Mongoliibacter sp.]TVP45097.1 MAG: carboxyl-terminal protease [Mongoliibacter sp.]
MNNLRLSLWSLMLAMMLVMISCNPEDEDVDPTKVQNEVHKAIYDVMSDWYYWNREMPTDVSFSGTMSNQDFLEQLRYTPLDRQGWTYITTQEAFRAAFTGQVSGVHGFRMGMDQNERLFIASVLKTGPAGADGWQRGWQILEINGKQISEFRNSSGGYSIDTGPNQVGISNTFKFKLPDGTETTRTITKEAFSANSVAFQDVFEVENKKVGYWVYESFRASPNVTPTKSIEVEESFNKFISEGIDELIIDLRYNGGGSVDVALQVMNYLIPASADNRTAYVYRYNGKQSTNNRTVSFRKEGGLSINKIVFITARGSASASELIINSLKPYMDVTIVGDNTYGKPVGQFPLSSFSRTLVENNVEVVPVTFSLANSRGEADFFEGFKPDAMVGDDLTRNWGDKQEARLAAALNMISSGGVSARMANTYYRPKWEMIDQFEGLEKEFPMF